MTSPWSPCRSNSSRDGWEQVTPSQTPFGSFFSVFAQTQKCEDCNDVNLGFFGIGTLTLKTTGFESD